MNITGIRPFDLITDSRSLDVWNSWYLSNVAILVNGMLVRCKDINDIDIDNVIMIQHFCLQNII